MCSAALSPVQHSPPPSRDIVFVNRVWRGGGCVGDHILQDCFTMHVARCITITKLLPHPQDKIFCEIGFPFYAPNWDIGCSVAMWSLSITQPRWTKLHWNGKITGWTFQPLFKNIGEKPVFWKGVFSITFSPMFKKSASVSLVYINVMLGWVPPPSGPLSRSSGKTNRGTKRSKE